MRMRGGSAEGWERRETQERDGRPRPLSSEKTERTATNGKGLASRGRSDIDPGRIAGLVSIRER